MPARPYQPSTVLKANSNLQKYALILNTAPKTPYGIKITNFYSLITHKFTNVNYAFEVYTQSPFVIVATCAHDVHNHSYQIEL